MAAITIDPIGEARVVAATAGMERDDWLALRRQGIGGSDAAAIAGLSRWRSPLEVWLDKTGAPLDDDSGEAAYWGTVLEPIIRDEVARREGVEIVEVPALLAHPLLDWMLVNLDGDVPELDAIYEGKTASAWLRDEWEGNGIPDAYVLQAQHALAVTGRARAIFGVLIGGQRLEVRTVERDDELIDHLITLEAGFWRLVENRTPPEPDGSKACSELLAHLWDVQRGLVRTVDGDELRQVETLIAERAEAKAAEKAAAASAAEAENRLKALVGEAEALVDPDGRPLFTWKEQARSGLDVTALREAHPDIAEQFTTTTTFRKVHFPKRKG